MNLIVNRKTLDSDFPALFWQYSTEL